MPRDTSQAASAAKASASAAHAAGSGTTPAPEPPDESAEEFPQHMMKHLEAVDALRAALIDGKLSVAKDKARWLAEHPMAPELLPAWKPHFDKMKKAAKSIVEADDLSSAALGFGVMSEACGECHAEFSGPTYEPESPPPPATETKGEMARHAWAAERMTLAVVAPSDALWKEGTAALAEPALRDDELAQGVSGAVAPKVAELADWLHELGDPKSEARLGKSRGEVLGELLATCNACHEIARPK